MNDTKIEWTDFTWNPCSGCTEVSPGCDNCYARVRAERFRGTIGFPHGFDPVEKPHKLHEPLIGKAKGSRFFVNSMSDLFHRAFSPHYIAAVFGVMATAKAKGHTFQVLTKRPQRALAWFKWLEDYWNEAWDRYEAHGGEPPLSHAGSNLACSRDTAGWQVALCAAFAEREILAQGKRGPAFECGMLSSMACHPTSPASWPLPNVWIGTSIESESFAPHRLKALREIPAAVRFVSAEPLLGPLESDLRGIDWVIIGGESGKGARPMELWWVEDLIEQAHLADAAVFVKQLGSVWAASQRSKGNKVHPKGGDPMEWLPHLRVREYPSHEVQA